LAENPSDVFAHLNGDAVDVWPAADGLCSAPCTFEVEKKDALERHRGTTEVLNEDEMTMTALPACQTFAERKKWESMCAFDPPEAAPGAQRPARYPMYWLGMGLYQEENYDRNIVCTNPDPTAKGVRPPGRLSQRPWTSLIRSSVHSLSQSLSQSFSQNLSQRFGQGVLDILIRSIERISMSRRGCGVLSCCVWPISLARWCSGSTR